MRAIDCHARLHNLSQAAGDRPCTRYILAPAPKPLRAVLKSLRHDPGHVYWQGVRRPYALMTREHVPAGHTSCHPLKPHLIVTDCHGRPMGNESAIIDGDMKQLSRPKRAAA